MFPRPNSHLTGRWPAFGLVDALVGIFLLALAGALLTQGASTLLVLEQRRATLVDDQVKAADWEAYASWF